MLPIPTVAVGLVAVSLALLFWLVAAPSDQRLVRKNLQRGLGRPTARDAGVRRPGAELKSRLPKVNLNLIGRLLDGVGRPAAWPVDRVVTVKLVLGLVGLGLAVLLWGTSRGGPLSVVAIALPVVLFFVPEILLYNGALKRRESIGLELPDTLDQISIAVEAGLGFDAALVRVARSSSGVLSEELVRTLQDIQLGQPRRQAYELLASRTKVPVLRRFIRSVIQAEEYGIALADVLHAQAKELRVVRRQNAEMQAMKIRVKVLFPMAFCILPVLFLIILGPAVINIMQSFQR